MVFVNGFPFLLDASLVYETVDRPQEMTSNNDMIIILGSMVRRISSATDRRVPSLLLTLSW